MSQQLHYQGLTSQEVLKSREEHGSNTLTPPAKVSAWKEFLKKFSDPLIIILIIAGIMSVSISCYEYWGLGQSAAVFFEPAGIFIAIILATSLAFFFEQRAEREFALLNKVSDDEAVQVIRDGHPTSVPRKDIVVGDIIILSTGNEVPADGELLDATALLIDESTLTGETSCSKTVDPEHFDPDATFPGNHVFRGTKVMEGHGEMRVFAVGDATENGKVFEAVQIDNSVKTPLNEQLDKLGRQISWFSYIVAALIVIGRMALYFIHEPFEWLGFIAYLLQSLMIAVTLVVVSVPEGLPMAVTLALALSMRRMLRTNNLVRKLHACETMGATTVICTDKTGTLTQNRMQVAHTEFFGNPPENIIEQSIAVNSTARLDTTQNPPAVLGNPTEGALLLWLFNKGADYQDIREKADVIAELPFSTERKLMATAVKNIDASITIFVKGAPEIVYDLCSDNAGLSRDSLVQKLEKWQNQAMRTLAFAYRILPPGSELSPNVNEFLHSLTFAGICAISDPVRPDVPVAMQEVLDAGIKVKIVTGDTPGTAKEIGRQTGLWNDDTDTDANIATGADIAAMSDIELRRHVNDLKIIARARPMDKKRLVEALQHQGHVVAVTGDGTNDAPALKSAQVGLSMGDGTSVAKEASDITIVDNSFTSIGRAVMWGRSLYRNIQRFILFQMTVNVVACVIVLSGAFIGLQSPLTVTQMLWVNLIMDTFAAMALASLPPAQSVMAEKPRPRNTFIINKAMWEFIIGTGVLFAAILFALLYKLEHTAIHNFDDFFTVPFSSDRAELTPYEISFFFSVFVFMQFWNMFNARAFATGRSAFHFKGCSGFLLIAAIIFIGQITIVTFGGQFFTVMPLEPKAWLLVIVGTSPVLLLGEIWRFIANHRHGHK